MDNNRIILTDASGESSEEEKFDDPALMFGHTAHTKFWQLYKNERKFKDYGILDKGEGSDEQDYDEQN